MANNVKVILIGGSPMIGKTTLATELALKYRYNCISTDDIGEIVQTIIDINPMKDFDYREYYIKNSVEKLIKETLKYHKEIWKPIKHLIEIHSEWSNPIIIEGWALYPKLLRNIDKSNIKCLWLIAGENVLEKRILDKKEFYKGASNKEKMISNYLKRSKWHNKKIYDEVVELDDDYIMIDKDLTKEELVDKAMQLLSGNSE
ncbi:hypothetical protein [Orenia marismortui]|uniref:Dephospho-CoA kinase n=1 Tax=Orenia marismortui TaxID=46469 RepID=A0A4R8GLU3_9FIRM|nr:hypothetical protein [Orenia marismortui]TDX42953.1 hypothetical protein C7959_1742 [Orenia marismortui]